jgi:hypothetical protein
MTQIVIKSKYYHYYPRCLNEVYYHEIYEELKDKCQHYDNNIKGTIYKSKRASCVFSALDESKRGVNAGSKLFSYTFLETFAWESSPLVSQIKDYLEAKFNLRFDYCLAHIYPDGQAGIPYHNDKEALDTSVVSVSFGASRFFRFRLIGQTKGFIRQFNLENGDVFHMLEGCQRKLEHSVPEQKTIKGSRINLTFRIV